MNELTLVKLLDTIKNRLGNENNVNDEIIKSFISDYSIIVCNTTCYKELPERFYPYVIDATIESVQRVGHEGMGTRSELGVNTSYAYKDIEDSIRSKVRGLKNPRAYLGYWS